MRTFTTIAVAAVFLAIADHHAVLGEQQQKLTRDLLRTEESSGRALKSSKGGGKGKGSVIDCIDIDATPAPTKGTGGSKGSSKGSSVTDGSAAPSYFCSEAPSVAPSTSTAPSTSASPSLSPVVSKGKGGKGGKGGKMMKMK